MEGKPSRKQSTAKGFAVLTASNLFVRVLGFIYVLPLTRLIGNEGNGLYGVGYQIYIFLFILSNTGLPAAIAKAVSENRAVGDYESAHIAFKVAMRILLTLGFLTTGMMVIAAYWVDAYLWPRTFYTILALSPTLLLASVMSGFRGYFQGMTLMTPTGVSQIIEQIAKAVSAVGLAYLLLGRGVEIAAGGATFGTTLGALFGTLYLAVRYYRARPEIREDIRLHQAVQRRHSPSSLLRTVVRYAVPITLGSAVLSMGNLVDLALVGARLQRAGFTQTETDALYGILNTQNARLVNLPTALSTALAAALLPGISAAVAERNAESLRYKTTEALKVSTLIAAPAAIGLSVLSHSVIAVLFPSHPDGGDVLAIGALSILFISLVQVLTAVLQGAGKMHLPPIFLLCGVLIKSVLNYHLVAIPELNIRGAVISSVVAYFAVVIADYLALTRTVRVAVPVREVFVRPVASAAIMGVVVCMAREWMYALGLPNVAVAAAGVFLGIVVYGACVIALRGITPGELERLPGGSYLLRQLVRLRVWPADPAKRG
jgi:stage V sporulation protein B